MPIIRPISDLRNNSGEISELCRRTREPVFITKNGVGDMVVQSMETYERQQARIELYEKLAEAQAAIAAGDKGRDFFEVVEEKRNKLIGRYNENL